MPVGNIVGFWCYPVKSMQGVELNAATLTERGLLGDRAYAVLDNETGHIASAKYPRKWAPLFECHAVYELTTEPTREADRTPLHGTPGQEVIHREHLALAAPQGTFFDYAPVHILTTETLNRLRELHPEGRFDIRWFRANIVVAPSAHRRGYVEHNWLGQLLSTKVGVCLQVIDPCPRCVVTTLAQGDLPRDPDILRTISQHNFAVSVTLAPGMLYTGVAGVYAGVRGGGTLHHGDTLYVSC